MASPNTGVVFTGPGLGDTIANDGSGGTFDVITISDPSPYDLSDISQFNASMSIGCSCTSATANPPLLQACSHPYLNYSFLFRQKSLQQLSPILNSSSSCQKLPIASQKNGIRFHFFEEGVLERQMKGTTDDPMADHFRDGTRGMGSSSSGAWVNDMYVRGWEHIYGDAPGYKSGRQITFESGKIKKGILDSTVYQKLNLTFASATDENGESYTILQGMSGYYIRDICIYHKSISDNLVDHRFHLIFRYNVASGDADCITDSFRQQAVISQEDVIDNVGIQPSFQTVSSAPSTTIGSPAQVLSGDGSGHFVIVDTRYLTADFIELRGYQPDITSIIAYGLAPTDFFDNVLTTDNFAASFDSRGRLFVFYEDQFNYTQLPYISFSCAPKSSSSALPSPSTTPTPTTTGIGVTTGGTGGGAGGGGGGGGGGAGGIPGSAPTPVQYSKASSSSSSPSSSSSSSAGQSSASSSSSSAVPTTPPPPVTNPSAGATRNSDGDGEVNLTWGVPPGTTITGQSPTTSSSSSSPLQNVTFTIQWSCGDIEGPYTQIASGLTNTQFTQGVGTDSNEACEGDWNYYKIIAVDQYGNKSSYQLVQIFLILPAPCYGRDCVGCVSAGFKSRNSFTVYFSIPSPYQLAFECEACSGASENSPAFVRILDTAFYQQQLSQLTIGTNTSSDDPVPIMFCLLANCNDEVANQCQWTNTFYIPALTNNCAGFGCSEGFDTVLLPMTVTLTQTMAGWTLDAYAIGPDCKKLQIFATGDAVFQTAYGHTCTPPTRFVSSLPQGPAAIKATATIAGTTNNQCAVYPPDAFFNHTGTISAAMSPDMGQTWYQYKGIIEINNDRMAVKPVISHDDKTNTFHLFWVDRDYIDDNSQLLIQGFSNGASGFQARVFHAAIKADYFKEKDAFIDFYPAPGTTNIDQKSGVTIPSTAFTTIANSSSSSSSTVSVPENPYYTSIINQFTEEGRLIRRANQHLILYQAATGEQPITVVNEQNSAYVDNQGRINYVRFRESGTLFDPPARLTRVRRVGAACGIYTWAVSGITDTDCSCQASIGSFRLELNKQTAVYQDSDVNWTLSVSADYEYWVMSSSNGMLSFRHRRDLTQCPPIGTYDIVCNRCLGNIVGTLDVERVLIQGRDSGDIDNGNFTPQQNNLTDFGNVPLGSSAENQYVVFNNTPSVLNFTGTPQIYVGGVNNPDFVITQHLPSSIPAYSFDIFAIRFSPSQKGLEGASISIVNDSSSNSPYIFNLQGTGIAQTQSLSSSSSTTIVQATPDGIVYCADSVGTIFNSVDEGTTWSSNTLDIRTGEWATLTYDRMEDTLHCVYVVDDMLFSRRYPSLFYNYEDVTGTNSTPAFDGLNIVQPPEVVIPDENAAVNTAITTATGADLGSSLGALDGLSSFFSLPNLKTPGDVLDTFEQDYTSIAIPIVNEKDYGGVPLFLVGNIEGAFVDGHYSYPPTYIFGLSTSVGQSKPAAYITSNGKLRFFYSDINGNVNGGSLVADQPSLDTKRKSR